MSVPATHSVKTPPRHSAGSRAAAQIDQEKPASPSIRMRDWERRKLTEAEIRIGQSMFADEIDWSRVRIAQAPAVIFSAMVPFGDTIWFGRWRAPRDFSQTFNTEQAWFIHELAHVWQARRGKVLAVSKLSALHKHHYHVELRPGAGLDAYNIEAQGEVARFLYLARCGEKTRIPLEELEKLWASR
ncbi:MAG: hypothetical protein ABW199_07030 [Caulobacterales bacterium]